MRRAPRNPAEPKCKAAPRAYRELDCSQPDIVCLDYRYDALNRVDEIYRDGDQAPRVTYSYAGKFLGSRSVRTTAGNTFIVYNPDYDEHRRIDPLENSIVFGGDFPPELASFDYAYDGVGNRTAAYGQGNPQPAHDVDIDYAYDDLHRLTSATYDATDAETFYMDLVSNRTRYTDDRDGDDILYYRDNERNNAANEYLWIDNKAIEHDAAGNLRKDELGYRYSYDFENRLVKVEHATSAGPGGGAFGPSAPPPLWRTVAEFVYDALGRRIRATYYDNPGVVSQDMLYYYDGQRVLAEFDYDEGSGEQTLARYFVDGATYVDEHLLMHDAASGVDYYYVPRELHSVAGLVDQNGAWVEVYAYDAYGAAQLYDALGTPLTASAIGNPYFFTGRRLEVLSNMSLPRAYRQLYHYRARAYDPRHGRFAQRDPAEYADGMNLYEYARSSPVVLVDPFGRWSRTAAQLVGRCGEVLLINAIKADPSRVILHGLGKKVMEHGPDLITYNRQTGGFEFWDNKAYQRTGKLSRAPKWMTRFNIREYESVIARGIQNVRDPVLRRAYHQALRRAMQNPGNAVKAITSLGGYLTGVSPKLAEQGIQFVTRETLEATARGGAGRAAGAAAGRGAGSLGARTAGGVCRMIFTRTSAVLTILLEVPEAGRGSEIYFAYVDPETIIDEVLDEIACGIPDYYSGTRRPFNYEQLQQMRTDFVARGLLVSRRVYEPYHEQDVYRYQFRSDLSEDDLDYINRKINIGNLIPLTPVRLEFLDESSIDWVPP
jgi:RHS repeat-associated protein